MRFRSHGIDKQYTYPCSKHDVKAAFGEDLLDGAWFGLTLSYRQRSSRYSPQPNIQGTVVIKLSMGMSGECSLYGYRVLKADFDQLRHTMLVELIHGQIRDWVVAKKERTETEIFGREELLVELLQGEIRLHETRFR